QAARSAVVVAESQAGPSGGSAPGHFASMVGCTLPAALASLLAVLLSGAAPAAGRQLTEAARPPPGRPSSQAAMTLRFILTNFSTAWPMAKVHGGSPAARATGTETADAASTAASRRLRMVNPPLSGASGAGGEVPPHKRACRQGKMPAGSHE